MLDNARVVWARYVEKNRRDVEERAEQLKGISNLAALVAGFALVSFLQFDFSASAGGEGVQFAFGLTIALTVAVEALAMVMCSLIHASILKTGRAYVSAEEEADFMARANEFAARSGGDDATLVLLIGDGTAPAHCLRGRVQQLQH